MHCNGKEALSIVALPAPFQHELEHYTLHPSLLDAALQTALIASQGAATALPFSVKEVEILHPLGSSAYAFARRIGLQRFDVCLLDQNGLVCVRFNDLCLRPLRDPLERFFYTPRWKPCPLPKHAGIEPAEHVEHVVIIYSDQSVVLADMLAAHHASANVYRILLGTKDHRSDQLAWEVATEMPQALSKCLAPLKNIDCIYFLGGIRTGSEEVDDLEALDLSQERGVLSLFRTLKSLNERGLTQPVDLFIITNDVFSVMPRARTQPHSAGLLGLGKVIAKEFPRLQVRCLDISLAGVPPTPSDAEAQTLLRAILAEPAHCESEVVIREGQRYVQTLEPTQVPAVSELPYRKGGVYLILGGAGGLGFEFSRYLADTVQARLVWVGRSELDAAKQEKISQIESRGGEVLYLQADATDPASMLEAVHQAKEKFGAIQGAVHSAIVLSDRTLANMSELEFDAAFAPKVRGSAVLYKVLKDEPLDFLLFFSSANSFMASMGQANYVAGCCFKDALGRHLDQIAGFPSKVINWGYWGTTGIVSGKDYRRRITAQGHRSIHPKEGMDAIGRVLSAPFGQAVVMDAQNEALVAMGVDLTAQVRLYPEQIPSLVQEMVAHEDALALDRQCVRRFRQGFEQLEQLGRSWLVAALRRMGILFEPKERYDPVELKARLGITEAYSRLFDTLLDLLIDAGVLVRVGGELLSTDKLRDPAFSIESADLEIRKNILAQSFPEVAERIPLLAACLESLPEVLTGKTKATWR